MSKAKPKGSHFVSPINDELIISRIHELIYSRCYNQKSIEVILVKEFNISYDIYRTIFKKVSERMRDNANELLDLAGERIMTTLFEMLDDDNKVIKLKAIEMMMKMMDIKTRGLQTIAMKNELYDSVKFEFAEVIEPDKNNLDVKND